MDGKACGWLSKEIPCTREIPLVLQVPFCYVLLIQIELVSPCTTLYRDQDILKAYSVMHSVVVMVVVNCNYPVMDYLL